MQRATNAGCYKHGLFAGREVGEACPTCGEPLVDVVASRELFTIALDGRMRARLMRNMLVALAFTLAVLGAFSVLTDTYLLTRSSTTLTITLSYLLLDSLSRRFGPPEWRAVEAALAREDRYRWRRLTGMPTIVAVVVVAAYAVQVHAGASATRFALVPEEIRRGEHLYTLVTSAFLHVGVLHLVLNGVALLAWGQVIDLRVGRLASLALLLVTAVAGGVAHAFLTSDAATPTVGLSGGIYGLFGAMMTLVPSHRLSLPYSETRTVPAWIGVPLFTVGYALFDVAFRSNVAWAGHIGGAVAGALLGLALRRIPTNAAFVDAEARLESALAPRV